MRFSSLILAFDTALEYCALLYLYDRICGAKPTRWAEKILLHALTIAGFALIPVFIEPYVAKCLAYACVGLLAAQMFDQGMYVKLGLGLLASVIQLATELVVVSLLFWRHPFVSLPLPVDLYAKGVLYSRLTALAAMVIISRLFTKRLDFAIKPTPRQGFWLVVVTAAGLFVLETLFAALGKLSASHDETLALLICIGIVCAVWLYLLFSQFDRQGQKLAQQKYAYMEALQKIQGEHWQAITGKNQTLRILTHDVKNFLLTLRGYLQNGQTALAQEKLDKYLGALIENQPINSGILIFDTVLSAKEQLAKEKNLVFRCTVLLNEKDLHIDPVDVARLFANALDNAIEAASQCDAPAQVSLDMRASGEYLHITVENTVAQPVTIRNNHLATTKTDKTLHGVGIKSMKVLAAKYNGKVLLSCHDYIFSTIIILHNKPAQ